MKLSRYHSAVFALACSAGFLHADIVILKDGKKLEGNITAETPTSIHMRYRLTPKIWDDKDILRTDIIDGGIIKQKPEEVELIELKKSVPTPDLLTAEKYEQLIQDRLRPFLNRYPGTPEAAEVETMMKDIQEEKEKVVAGGVKIEGKWLTREEAKAEILNIKAYGLRAAMLERVAVKDYPGALKEFDKLSDPRSGNLASIYYPKAVEEILAVLTTYDAQITQMIKDQPTLQKMREDNIKKLIEPDLSRMNDAIKTETEKWRTTYEQEKKVTKWFLPYKYDLESLKLLAKSVSEEKELLRGVNVAVMTKVNEAIAKMLRADAKASKEKEELAKLGEAIVEGETAAANADTASKEFYRGVFTNYRARYEYFSKVLDAAVPGQAAAATGAAGGSTAIAGSATPGMDDKVAAALAAAAGGSPPAAAVAPVPGAVPGMPAGQPGMAPGGVAPAGYPPQPGQPGYMAPQPPQAAPMPVEEEGISTTTMLLIGGGVVVLVLLLTLLAGGKKKKK